MQAPNSRMNLIESAIELIKSAERPFIYAGGGVIISEASKELLEFADKVDSPIGLSMMGLSSVPGNNPRNLGMTGMHGKYAASKAMSESDLIIAIGTRFSDRATGSKPEFVKGKKFLHIDIDPAEIGKNIPAFVSVLGDVKYVLSKLNALIKQQTHIVWEEEIGKIRSCPDSHLEMKKNKLTPQAIIETVRSYAEDDVVIATDVGQHQMWVSQYLISLVVRVPLLIGGWYYGLRYGVAIGSCIGKNKNRTVLFTGDGLHMNLNEMATAVINDLPLIIIVYE